VQNFNCPNCGGMLDYTGSEPTTRCPYCSNLVPVPFEFRQAGLERQATQTAKQVGKWVIVFFVLVVGLPTCLGLVATVLGIVMGLAGPLLAIILTFLVRR